MLRTKAMTTSSSTTTSPLTNILDIYQKILQVEGWQGLFKGTFPRIFRAILSGAVQFTSYELGKSFISK